MTVIKTNKICIQCSQPEAELHIVFGKTNAQYRGSSFCSPTCLFEFLSDDENRDHLDYVMTHLPQRQSDIHAAPEDIEDMLDEPSRT